MSTYPSNIPVFPTLTDEVDVVAANDVNSARNEIIALCTYIGTTPQGSTANLASRLNVMINGSGVVNNSTGFPDGSTVASYPVQLFYRRDSETLYIRRYDNTAWQAVGQSAANCLFQWHGNVDAKSLVVTTGGLVGSAVQASYSYLFGDDVAGNTTVFKTKFNKISGINTVNVYTRLWNLPTSVVHGTCSITIGSLGALNLIALNNDTVPTYYSGTIDVSGLTNGSFYDVSVVLSISGGTSRIYLGDLIAFGS